MKLGQEATSPSQWAAFTRRYKAEMAAPEARHDLALLAALSHRTDLSVGCYCEDEDRCHRSILRALLVNNGARVAS
jgi:uncharacterized protein YeaO (DUF488 family)